MKRQSLQAFPQMLWDLVPGRRSVKPSAPPSRPPAGPPRATSARAPSAAQRRYDEVTRCMLQEHGVRVRKWRTSSSGVAWQVTYRDGTVSRLIESPRPRGPVSAAIFLHEIGHHAIGFNRYKPRCLEEYHAWMYALKQMERWGLTITDRVHDRVHDSLYYAVCKARRRGLRELPAELAPYREPRRRRS